MPTNGYLSLCISRISSDRPVFLKIQQSTVRAGLGYAYVNDILVSFFESAFQIFYPFMMDAAKRQIDNSQKGDYNKQNIKILQLSHMDQR